ncbi:MAG: type II toxin-antitoxin system VapC family toxin [Rhodothermales bacterium]|nr:type II toxin-antitoxin system VapC family toxin [Rhodothermales bacterium]
MIDTNAVIEFLGGMLPPDASQWLEDHVRTQSGYLSVINQIELLGYFVPQQEMEQLEAFVAACPILALTDQIARRTIALKRQYRIKLPDAVIAASAIEHEMVLITRNLKDFDFVEGLHVMDSHRLKGN